MTTFENIDEHFPWIILGITLVTETLLVLWFTS
jgi:hypothetical protein